MASCFLGRQSNSRKKRRNQYEKLSVSSLSLKKSWKDEGAAEVIVDEDSGDEFADSGTDSPLHFSPL